MPMHIHLCKTNEEATLIIDTMKTDMGNPNLEAAVYAVPDVMVFSHFSGVDNPVLLNQNMLCVIANV